MPDNTNQPTNSQTLVIDFPELTYEPIEQENGVATVVRFKLDNPGVQPGDVLVVLSGEDIQFHGFINNVADGWATAADKHGSTLPASVN
jgi:hypothetical protein